MGGKQKTVLFFDIETFCETPIQNGTFAYAQNAEVIMYQYAVNEGDVVVKDGDENIAELLELIKTCDEIVIHNSTFERAVLQNKIEIPIEKVFDTMACAMGHGLQGSLSALCDILNVDADKIKDKEGKNLINLFCKPRPKNSKLRRATKITHAEEWEKFRKYGEFDIVAMREVYKKLPRWNYSGVEKEIWRLDQKINFRGVFVDQELAIAAIAASDRAQENFKNETLKLTGGTVERTNQRDKILEFILTAHGVALKDLTSSTVEKFLEDPDTPTALKELLHVRAQSSKSSVSKYRRVLNGVCSDGRLKGLLAFCGAGRTGRWSGRLFQPQNLPRPMLKKHEIELGIFALKNNGEDLI